MSRALYFDAFNGVSGDMVVGGLLDLGMPLEHLTEQLDRLALGPFQLQVQQVQRQGLRATDFKVCSDHPKSKAHEHAPHRSLSAIRRAIEDSGLEGSVIERATAIFQRLGEAEARVHGSPIESVHFHEVGGVDSIVDIVGSCIGFHYFGIREFYSSTLALGGGTVNFSHGSWPVPAPATAELVKGFPVRPGPVDAELTTPTGAAIVTTLVQGTLENMQIDRSGFGAGDREFAEIPNLLRVMLVDVETGPAEGSEEVVMLEAAIDNMDGELLGHVLEILLSEGALDVYYVPLQMKKSRPGWLLSVLGRPRDRERLVQLVFEHTTTLGVRCSRDARFAAPREWERVETEWGAVRVKIARWRGEVVNRWPEYEDLREIAERWNLPLKKVRHKVLELIGKES